MCLKGSNLMPLWTTGRKFTTLQECCSFLHWMAKIPSVCIVLPNTVACGFRNTQTFLKYRADVALYMFQINCGGSEICLRQDFQGAFSFLFYLWSLDKINVSSNRQIFYHYKTVCVLLLLTNFHKYWFQMYYAVWKTSCLHWWYNWRQWNRISSG